MKNIIKIKDFLIRNKADVVKFILYSTFFFFLFFTFQKANSPVFQTEQFNSAKEYTITSNTDSTKSSSISNSEDGFVLWKKEFKKPNLTISFNPDNVVIDETLLTALRFNINSKMFFNKVTPLDVTIDKTRKDPRWQVSWNKLILSGNMTELKESIKVFVHELWHLVDLRFLPNLWDYDPSENFYNISWVSYNVKKKNSKLVDYISWYALTNKYEDFAESFTFYIFHNEEFKKKSLTNVIISRKYNFFKKYIFIDEEFSNTSFEQKEIAAYNWDTTKIPVNLKKYLYYIR